MADIQGSALIATVPYLPDQPSDHHRTEPEPETDRQSENERKKGKKREKERKEERERMVLKVI